MHAEGFFTQAFIYLAAAVVSVPIAKRLGLGSVLGYLLAGVIIGPFVLGLIGEEGQDVMHFAEFGVVMMLFLIGLELNPSLLWSMKGSLVGLGGLQVGVTTAVLGSIGWFLGWPWGTSIAVGMILALSSTAIVLQTLAEKGLMKSDAGQNAFSVLLFQDIAVIPMLAILPLLGTRQAHSEEHGTVVDTWMSSLPAWAEPVPVLIAISVVILAGKYLLRPAFRAIARTRLRELFTAAALLLVIGIALLMGLVGLSPALGTFLAGLVLANSEYRHELEGDIEPFKGLLLGLFFIAVGASIDFNLLSLEWPAVLGWLAVLMAIKFVIIFSLGRTFKMGADQNILFSLLLAQGGEFAFVLFSFSIQQGVISSELVSTLTVAVALSMFLTPITLVLNERLIQPRFGTTRSVDMPADDIDEENPVIIAGFGRFGSIVGRFLNANGVRTTVLENDSDHVELLRRLGLKVFYGDASRRDLLQAAGASKARLLILAIDDREKRLSIVETARKHFPDLTILARAENRSDAYELLDHGVSHVYRETLDTALTAGVNSLRLLGQRAFESLRASRRFRCHDERSVQELRSMRHNRKEYLSAARQRIQDLEQQMLSELESPEEDRDAGWDSESLREDMGRL